MEPPGLFLRTATELTDTEDDKLCRFRGSDAHECDHAAEINRLRWVGLFIALDEVRFLGLIANELAFEPLNAQKCADIAPDTLPQHRVVGLKDHPLGAFLNRFFEKEKEAADIDHTANSMDRRIIRVDVPPAYAGVTATAELTVEITGSFSMTLTTPDNRLNTSGSAGGEIRQALEITNTGTAPLEGLTLRGTPPSGWSVRFDPETVPAIQPGAEQAVTAIITPSGDAIAGDYEVPITASNDTAGSTDLALRVTVETSLLWGLIGVAIIVAVFAGLWWVFQRYGRR